MVKKKKKNTWAVHSLNRYMPIKIVIMEKERTNTATGKKEREERRKERREKICVDNPDTVRPWT